jgi:transcriptional regulator with XRE-family HTH domain
MQHDDRSFGVQVRQVRERAGLTHEALAEQAGLTTNAISALERGERQRPYPHTVAALAEALRLSAAEQAALLAAPAATVQRLPPHHAPPCPPCRPRCHAGVNVPA